jgi:hypothetical protein
MHTAEGLVPGPTSIEDEICIEKLKRWQALGNDQILAELVHAF